MQTSELKNPVVFIDTNVFIHLRDLKDLPWKKLFPKLETLTIMVASRVIEELDEFKVGQNQRKRTRARAALKLIKESVRNAEGRLKIRDIKYKIYLQVPSNNKIDWNDFPNLDSSKPDDHLVAETLSYGNHALLFSHDSGPVIAALRMDILAFEPDGDAWFLPHQPSQDELKIRQLEKRLKLAEEAYPTIVASFGTQDATLEQIELIAPILTPLDRDLVEQMTLLFIKENPPHIILAQKDSFSELIASMSYDHYTQADKVGYENRYSAFKNEVFNFFNTLHESIHQTSNTQAIPYYVHNNSPVAASGLRVDISLTGECSLLADQEDAFHFSGSLNLPKPPEKPKKGFYPLDRISGLDFSHKQPRDPTAFYWEKRPKFGDQKSAVQCADFRATEVRNSQAWISTIEDIPITGSIVLKVSASNMRAPITKVSKYSLSAVETTWDDPRITNLMPLELKRFLRNFI